MPKVRKIPQRTCLGCQAVKPKRELVRIVRTPAGEVSIDHTGKKAGRGAYICPRRECLAGALAGNRLERALEISIPREVLEAIGGELARSVT